VIVRHHIFRLVFVALAACAAAQSAEALAQALSPSAINANPAAYDGQAVTVTGYLVLKPEAHVLYESRELDQAFRKELAERPPTIDFSQWDKYCLTVLNVKFLQEHRSAFDGKTVTLTGHVKSEYLDGTVVDLGACPLPTALILDDQSVQKLYAQFRAQ